MTWQDYLRAARDELLTDGQAINPADVVDRALAMDGGSELFDRESQARAHSASRRLASSLLRDTEQPDGDEQTASLFDATRYRPPRCVTILDESGELRHKAIEHATVPDCDTYESVLEENIGRAQRRFFAFRAFRDEIAADLAAHGTIGAALRARRDARAAA